MQKYILKCKPYGKANVNRGLRKFLYSLLENIYFRRLILLCLLLQLLLFTNINFNYSIPPKKLTSNYLKYKNFGVIILIIFDFEALMKIYTMRFRNYISNRKFRMEFFLTICISLEICRNLLSNKYAILEENHILLKVFNFLASLNLIRLFSYIKSLKNLLKILYFSWPLLFNMMIFLIVIFFFFGLLAAKLFDEVIEGDVIDDIVNFKNIFYSMMTLFKCSTGDDWSKILVDVSHIPPNCIPNKTCGLSIINQKNIYFII